MGLWLVFGCVYGVVTLFAIYMTYQEQKRRQISSPLFNLFGYVACAFWPILAAVLLIVARVRPASFARSESSDL